ncbi:hypothetical protein ACS04_33070 [Streptomyces roseus]|uniref:Uncharacterized protein n=1 Tax=Streptomyces roseus TaxID=66430 RepID=A0A0J6XCZ4_9ACTN|nr:hypothetical protein ACS04_33070 [Streptomyces roseus]
MECARLEAGDRTIIVAPETGAPLTGVLLMFDSLNHSIALMVHGFSPNYLHSSSRRPQWLVALPLCEHSGVAALARQKTARSDSLLIHLLETSSPSGTGAYQPIQ